MKKLYYILCRESPQGDDALWWRPKGSGYTVRVDDAGLYTEEEAARIERIRGTDIAVPADVVREAAVRVVPVGSVAQYNEPTLAKRPRKAGA